MQTNHAPKIRPATHGETGRYDTLDVSLLKSVINGNEDALRVLFTRHNVQIYRFVLRLTGNRSIAEEIVSDVFLEAWRHAARFGMRFQVSTWLLAIARNKAFTKCGVAQSRNRVRRIFRRRSRIRLTIRRSLWTSKIAAGLSDFV